MLADRRRLPGAEPLGGPRPAPVRGDRPRRPDRDQRQPADERGRHRRAQRPARPGRSRRQRAALGHPRLHRPTCRALTRRDRAARRPRPARRARRRCPRPARGAELGEHARRPRRPARGGRGVKELRPPPRAGPRRLPSSAPSSSSREPRTSRRSRRRSCASGSSPPGPIEMGVGTLIRYRLRLHGIPVSWLTRIEEWEPPHGFVDRQIRGPYALWHHTHTFEPIDDDRTLMTDVVRYGHRLGPLGSLAERLVVRRDLDRIFDHRRDSIPALLAAGLMAGLRAPRLRRHLGAALRRHVRPDARRDRGGGDAGQPRRAAGAGLRADPRARRRHRPQPRALSRRGDRAGPDRAVRADGPAAARAARRAGAARRGRRRPRPARFPSPTRRSTPSWRRSSSAPSTTCPRRSPRSIACSSPAGEFLFCEHVRSAGARPGALAGPPRAAVALRRPRLPSEPGHRRGDRRLAARARRRSATSGCRRRRAIVRPMAIGSARKAA